MLSIGFHQIRLQSTGWPASVGRMRSCCRLHRMDGDDCTWKQINNGELATQALARASAVWRGLQQDLQAAHHLVECGAVPRLLCPTVPASEVLVSTPVLGEQPAKHATSRKQARRRHNRAPTCILVAHRISCR